MQIEDTIFSEYLPVNAKAMLNRIMEILNENKTNNISSLNAIEKLKVRKILWLLNGQLEESTYNLTDEWRKLRQLSGL